MISTGKITAQQLKALQALWHRFAGKLAPTGDERQARLSWASGFLGHAVSSFKELSGMEAARMIDSLKLACGQQPGKRRRLKRDAAMARGTHGRRGRKAKVEMMATPEALEEVERLRARVGMTLENFESWLRSRSSPLCGRAEARLLTISDCNRVRWALQAMLRRGEAHGAEAKVS